MIGTIDLFMFSVFSLLQFLESWYHFIAFSTSSRRFSCRLLRRLHLRRQHGSRSLTFHHIWWMSMSSGLTTPYNSSNLFFFSNIMYNIKPHITEEPSPKSWFPTSSTSSSALCTNLYIVCSLLMALRSSSKKKSIDNKQNNINSISKNYKL